MSEPSNGGFFSAQEALALVAFGDPRALDDEAASDADEERAARLDQADRELCALVAAGAVPLFGRRGSYATGRFASNDHEVVPPSFFLNANRTLNKGGEWATMRDDAPFPEWEQWRNQAAPDWGDLRFDSKAIMSRFGSTAARTAPDVGGTNASDHSSPEVVTQNYSREALAAWFVLRVRTWKENAQFPTEAKDLDAARTYFGRTISRREFREVRRAKVPPSWRKPGPRRRRA